jgi:hypothetical protein
MPARFWLMTAPVEVMLTDGSFRRLDDLTRCPEPPIREFATFDDADVERQSFGPSAAGLVVVEIETP